MNTTPPEYFTVNDRPVKVVTTAQGYTDVLVFDWDSGEFERDMSYWDRLHAPFADVTPLIESEFNELVEAYRRKHRETTEAISPSPHTDNHQATQIWEWTEGDDQYSIELQNDEIIWRAMAYDERLGDFRASLRRQTTQEFLAHGPGEYVPSKIAREVAAHLGLNRPPWLKSE